MKSYKSMRTEPLTIGVSSKHVYRVFDDNKSYILIDFSNCANKSDELFTYFITQDSNNKSQIDYFIESHELLAKFKVHLPKMLAYDKTEKCVLLEDLSDLTIKKIYESGNTKLFIDSIYRSLDIINLMQSINMFNNHHLKDRYYLKKEFKQETLKIFKFLKYKHIEYTYTTDIIDDELFDDVDRIIAYLDSICTIFDELPKAAIHRDFQTTNIISKDNKLFLIDYQDLCMGPYIYDLISLVYDLNVDIDKDTQIDLIRYFWNINETAKNQSFNTFLYTVQTCAVIRILKSIRWRIEAYCNGNIQIYTEIERGIRYLIQSFSIIEVSIYKHIGFINTFINNFPSGVSTVILAAGKGKRMQSHNIPLSGGDQVGTLPKAMFPLKGKPMLSYVVDAAKDISSDHIYIVVGHNKEFIINHYNNDKSVKFVTQDEQLGTGHALAQTSPVFYRYTGDIISMMGDAPLISPDVIKEMITVHRSNNYVATILTKTTNNSNGCGRVIRNPEETDLLSAVIEEADIPNDEIRNIKEVTVGVIIFKAPLLYKTLPNIKNDNKQKEYYVWDLVRIYIEDGARVGIHHSDKIPPVHSANTHAELQQLVSMVF